MTHPSPFRALALLALAIGAGPLAALQNGKDVIFYPTYGFRQGTNWVVPMRAKAQEPRGMSAAVEGLARRLAGGVVDDATLFRSRIADLIADDKDDQDLRLQFDKDVERRDHRIANGAKFPETNDNGTVEGTLTLSAEAAQRLLAAQGSTNGWLSYRVVSRGHSGMGRMRLIEPAGVSVVSDIDDTIKVTEIPAGPQAIVLNTFFRKFVPTTELDTRYTSLNQAAFHYVSGGPWQLYRPIAETLIASGRFPEGSFHMKSLTASANLFASAETLARFVTPDGTVQHKLGEIGALMQRFPRRTFVLIGDSGEKDPEIYREVQNIFKAQVQEIVIRDVKNARQLEPERLTGMTVVAAPTVAPGVSQLSGRVAGARP